MQSSTIGDRPAFSAGRVRPTSHAFAAALASAALARLIAFLLISTAIPSALAPEQAAELLDQHNSF